MNTNKPEKYMFMYSSNGQDHFKHIDTREYISFSQGNEKNIEQPIESTIEPPTQFYGMISYIGSTPMDTIPAFYDNFSDYSAELNYQKIHSENFGTILTKEQFIANISKSLASAGHSFNIGSSLKGVYVDEISDWIQKHPSEVVVPPALAEWSHKVTTVHQWENDNNIDESNRLTCKEEHTGQILTLHNDDKLLEARYAEILSSQEVTKSTTILSDTERPSYIRYSHSEQHKYSKEENARIVAQLKEVTDMLEEGVKSVFTSDRYLEYLTFLGKFHKYSVNNGILIMMQNPNASYVAGFNDWKNKHNRYVKKGEKGIKIIAPVPYKTTADVPVLDNNNQPVIVDGKPLTEKKVIERLSFRVVSVFDVSQTDGEPLPSLAPELTAQVANYQELLAAIYETSDFDVKFEDISGGAKGLCNYLTRTITIKPGMSQAQTIKTAIHEEAHARLHDTTQNDIDPISRETKEVQAESIAYVVSNYFGVDTSDYSFDYIASWSTDKEIEELKESLEVIQNEASSMIEIIEAKYGELIREKETIREDTSISVAQQKESSPAPEITSDTTVVFPYDSYLEIKQQTPDSLVFYQVGDFFEAYDADAITVAQQLNLTLTSRSVNDKERVTMVGVPKHTLESYTKDLKDKGFNVIVITKEQQKLAALVSSHKKFIATTPNEHNTIVINAFAGPGAGKTTSCLEICAELKKAGYVAEYVQEYAKELVWEGKTDMLSGTTEGQLHILQEQLSRMDRLYGKVDFIVTDCPVLLPAIYLKEPNREFEVASKYIFEHFSNFNYFVERDVSSFETKGRIHNLEESLKIDETLKTTLSSLGLQYGTYNHSTIQNIVKDAITYRDTAISNTSKAITSESPIPVPDNNISVTDMYNYGYTESDMLPVDPATASHFWEYLPEIPMYKLYPDNTEVLLKPGEETIQDDLLYGIEKADWEQAYSKYFYSPHIKIMWSEHLHPKLEDNTILTIKEADSLFESCDLAAKAAYPNGRYDKTKFVVFYTANNEMKVFIDRQDFGDGDGSLTTHISQFNENLSLLLKHHCLVDVLGSYPDDTGNIRDIRDRLNALDPSDNDNFIEKLSEISNDIDAEVQRITHRDVIDVTATEHTSPSTETLSNRVYNQDTDIASKVRDISIVDYASKMGFTVQEVGSYYTLKEHDSVRIDPRTNRYFRNSTGKRGSIIDFVMEFENVSQTQAISQLARYLGSDRSAPTHTVSSKPREKKTKIELPKKGTSMKNIFAYLIQTRKISPEVVNQWVANKNLYQDVHNNCVFVTYDSKGKPAFASQRGTNTSKPFKADVPGSNYDVCHFINNGASTLIVGEAMIDIMSVQTIMKAHGRDLSKYNYLSLNGSTKTHAVINALQSSKTDTVILATDNDTAGKIARDTLRDLIFEYNSDIKVEDYVPKNEKDWNAELVSTVLSEETIESPSDKPSISDMIKSGQSRAEEQAASRTVPIPHKSKNEPNL